MTERQLFEAYNKDVFRMCYYMLCNKADAEDVCQEVFISVFRANWQQIEHLKAWLMKITVSRCLNHLKKTRLARAREKINEWLFIEKQSGPADLPVMEQESESEMIGLLSVLPPKIRSCVFLRYFEELSVAEIADVLSIPAGTVKSRLHSGMKKLKILLERDEKERGGALNGA